MVSRLLDLGFTLLRLNDDRFRLFILPARLGRTQIKNSHKILGALLEEYYNMHLSSIDYSALHQTPGLSSQTKHQ